MNLGLAIKTIRKQKNLPQWELAEMCEISVNALSQMEKSITYPQKRTLDKICNSLNISVGALYIFALEKSDFTNSDDLNLISKKLIDIITIS